MKAQIEWAKRWLAAQPTEQSPRPLVLNRHEAAIFTEFFGYREGIDFIRQQSIPSAGEPTG